MIKNEKKKIYIIKAEAEIMMNIQASKILKSKIHLLIN